ncbi:uncharacterized protein VTP21DRAFT_9634 [Calcarisporiella thermophila]|uniref:uncharacterized protein n=1 Tax=Calcarisporiella thermophila TaxID=911321 RepID=UPI0037445A47
MFSNIITATDCRYVLATITASSFVIAIFVSRFVLKKSGKSKSLPPVVSSAIPFIGSMMEFYSRPLQFLVKCRSKYGDIFSFTAFGQNVTVVLGTEGNNFLFNAKNTDLNAEEAYRPLTVPVFGEGVVYDVPNSVLLEQKRMVRSILTIENLKKYVPIFEEETKQYITKHWNKNKGDIYVLQSMAELITLTASSTLLGAEFRAHMDEKVALVLNDLGGAVTPLNIVFTNFPLPSNIKRNNARAKMRDICLSIVNHRRKSDNIDDNQDLLQTLMSATYKNGRKLNDVELAHLLLTVLMAGQHTSASTAAWTIVLLAQHPHIIEKILAEQKRELGESLPPLTYDSLKKLQYLDNCIREALRIRPPLVTVLRKAINDVPIPNTDYVIPAGHYVVAAPLVTHLDEKLYHNALEYNPSRWEESIYASSNELGNGIGEKAGEVDFGFGNVSLASARSPWIPFGAGRHRCIGETFAFLQIKSIVATMVREFDFNITEKGVPQPRSGTMFVIPEEDATIRYQRRF